MTEVHLVRHGRVENPEGVLYGRLPGFGLSAEGRESALWAARELRTMIPRLDSLRSSPLQRALESAEPISAEFGVGIEQRDDLVEASSKLEGGRYRASLRVLRQPSVWVHLRNPFQPSWGEPFREVAERMSREVIAAARAHPDGHVVLVSHELPIWMVHRLATHKRLFHDPRRRRCALSSITSLRVEGESFTEIGYRETEVFGSGR